MFLLITTPGAISRNVLAVLGRPNPSPHNDQEIDGRTNEQTNKRTNERATNKQTKQRMATIDGLRDVWFKLQLEQIEQNAENPK